MTTAEATPPESAQAEFRPARAAVLVRVVPCALVVGLWLTVIPPSGGYFPRSWYPIALINVLFFCLFRVGARATFARGPSLRIALTLFAALVAWAFASILWADSPGSAWEAANKLIVVLAMAGIVAQIAWTPGALTFVLGAWSLGVALLCAGRLITWLGTSASDFSRFIEPASDRFSDPLGYPNATAALPVMAMVPALLLASLREVPRWMRAAALPVAVFLGEFALFAQSRGALVGGVVALAVLLVLAGERLRIIVRLAIVALLAAPAVKPVIDVGNAALAVHSPVSPLHHAAPIMLATVVAAALVGVLLVVGDERLNVPQRAARGAAVALASLAVLAVAGTGIAYGGQVRTWVHDAWAAGTAPGANRLLSLAPEERPDYARVAVKLFRENPVGGVGAGNFGRSYDARRHFEKHSRYAHDIWLRVLSEHGIVGIALFLAILGAIVTGVLANRRRQSAYERSLVAGCLAVGAYFLVHGSLDWLEEFPALAMPAVGLAFAALALAPRPEPGRAAARVEPAPASRRRLATVGGGVALGAVLVSLVPAWLAVRYLDRGNDERLANPAAAFRDYDRSAAWNKLDPAAPEAAGALALGLGEDTRARASFTQALDREPNWFSYLQLALMDAQGRRFDAASTLLAKASALDAADPVIADARRKISHREKVNPSQVDEKAMESPLFRPSQMP